jgi:transcriptional regulator with XRE-family HTH domain
MIGDRLRQYRTKRGLYLVDVATQVDISTAQLSRLETGERRLTDRSLVVRLAQVLGCSPAELMGHPIDWSDPDMVDAQASVAGVRLALATTELGRRGDGAARPLTELADATARVVELRTACDLSRMGAALPDLITELHTLISESTGDDRTAALQLLVVACNSAMTLAHGTGYTMEAWVAAQRTQQVADELDPAWRAIATFSVTHAMLAMGGHEQAHRTASAATDSARSLEGRVSNQPAQAAYGSLLLVSALTASVTGRGQESADRLVEASDVADRTGECSPLVAMFGPTNTAIYSMTSALERGDHAAAMSLARSVDLSRIPSSERRAKFHMDHARSLAGAGADEDAVTEYRRAESDARNRLYGNAYARQTVAELRDRMPRDSDAGQHLRSLAYRMNLVA